MTQTTARIKQTGKHFEIIVNLENALKFRRGESSSVNFLEIDNIFTDAKKGLKPAAKELKDAFGTEDVATIATKIVKNGEIQLTQDFREEERDKKIKQVVDFLSRNAVDPKTGNPHTAERIKMSLEQAHVNIKNGSIESQISEIVENLSKVLPIKLATKKVKILIPAMQTGKAYGVVSPYKEKENWMDNGDLEVTISIPAGLIMDFYDKLNSVTHGSALTEEIKEE